MNIFDFRRRLIDDYAGYTRSFIHVRDPRPRQFVDRQLDGGRPLARAAHPAQPGLRAGGDDRRAGRATESCTPSAAASSASSPSRRREGRRPPPAPPPVRGHPRRRDRPPLRPDHRHRLAARASPTSSRSWTHVLRRGSGQGIQAIVVYPMNALANSQRGELEKFLCHGYPHGRAAGHASPATPARSRSTSGSASSPSPPDILLTNYVMLELMLTRPEERHADRRRPRGCSSWCSTSCTPTGAGRGPTWPCWSAGCATRSTAPRLQCVGTSATLAGVGSQAEQQAAGRRGRRPALRRADVQPDTSSERRSVASPLSRDEGDPAFVAALAARVTDLTSRRRRSTTTASSTTRSPPGSSPPSASSPSTGARAWSGSRPLQPSEGPRGAAIELQRADRGARRALRAGDPGRPAGQLRSASATRTRAARRSPSGCTSSSAAATPSTPPLEPEADRHLTRPGAAVRARRPAAGPPAAGVLPRVRPGVLLRPAGRPGLALGLSSSPAS